MFQLNEREYAAVLHSTHTKDVSQSSVVSVFEKVTKDEYKEIFKKPIPFIASMDCITLGSNAYVALAIEITPENGNLVSHSPVFKVTAEGRVTVVHTTVIRYQRFVKLW